MLDWFTITYRSIYIAVGVLVAIPLGALALRRSNVALRPVAKALVRPLLAAPVVIYLWKVIVWDIVLGLGGTAHGVPREGGFEITVASEVMAILCLARDLADFKARVDSDLVGKYVNIASRCAGLSSCFSSYFWGPLR